MPKQCATKKKNDGDSYVICWDEKGSGKKPASKKKAKPKPRLKVWGASGVGVGKSGPKHNAPRKKKAKPKPPRKVPVLKAPVTTPTTYHLGPDDVVGGPVIQMSVAPYGAGKVDFRNPQVAKPALPATANMTQTLMNYDMDVSAKIGEAVKAKKKGTTTGQLLGLPANISDMIGGYVEPAREEMGVLFTPARGLGGYQYPSKVRRVGSLRREDYGEAAGLEEQTAEHDREVREERERKDKDVKEENKELAEKKEAARKLLKTAVKEVVVTGGKMKGKHAVRPFITRDNKLAYKIGGETVSHGMYGTFHVNLFEASNLKKRKKDGEWTIAGGKVGAPNIHHGWGKGAEPIEKVLAQKPRTVVHKGYPGFYGKFVGEQFHRGKYYAGY